LLCSVGLAVVVLGTGLFAAGCGGGSPGQAVATVKTPTTATEPSPGTTVSSTSAGSTSADPVTSALAFSQCMRSHGEPNFPEPGFQGHSAHITLQAGSGVDPSSPQFAAAYTGCKHLLPNNGAPTQGQTILTSDQADYLKAAACMRSHGVPTFPDPTFRDDTVSFKSQTPINTSSPQYATALSTCQKLIPAGLPYSSTSTGSGR
jgi:hypothetical protein